MILKWVVAKTRGRGRGRSQGRGRSRGRGRGRVRGQGRGVLPFFNFCRYSPVLFFRMTGICSSFMMEISQKS